MATQTISDKGLYQKEGYIDTGVGGLRKVNSSSQSGGVFTQIPIIDLTNATSSSFEQRKAVAKEIYDACVNVGFFYIKNHGVDEAIIDGCKREAARFFHELSTEDKMELDISKNSEFYGYAPIRTTMPDGAVRTRNTHALSGN